MEGVGGTPFHTAGWVAHKHASEMLSLQGTLLATILLIFQRQGKYLQVSLVSSFILYAGAITVLTFNSQHFVDTVCRLANGVNCELPGMAGW